MRNRKDYRPKGNKKTRSNKPSGTQNRRAMDSDPKTEEFAFNGPKDKISKGSLNDISWYNRLQPLLEATARVPFPYRPGMRLVTDGKFSIPSQEGGEVDSYYFIPGAMVLDWVPTLGRNTTPTDPANMAAKEIYAKVRSKFSSTLDADPPDFIIYMMCLDSIFSYIGFLKRLYRILEAYDHNNYAIPDALLAGMGLTYAQASTLRANKADLLYSINQLVAMTRRFQLPGSIDLFNRHYWMNDNVYSDDSTINSQLYLFYQRGYYMWDLQSVPSTPTVEAGAAVMRDFPPTTGFGWSVANLYNFGRGLIDALSESDDAYTISGYIMRAYEGEPFFTVDMLQPGENTRLDISFVPEVLSQIENSQTVDMDLSGPLKDLLSGLDILQEPSINCVITAPSPKGGSEFMPVYFSSRSDLPTYQDVTIMSRLKAVTYAEGEDDYIECGTELPLVWRVVVSYQGAIQFEAPFYTMKYMRMDGGTATSSVIAVNNLNAMCYASAFDWAPICVVMPYNFGATGPVSEVQPFLYGDLHNVSYCDRNLLHNINRACLLSELNAIG